MEAGRRNSEHSPVQQSVDGYSSREVAAVLGVPPAKVRALASAGSVEPVRDGHGRLRFSFQDLVLLRAAQGLSTTLPARRVRNALQNLRQQLPGGKPLSAVSIRSAGKSVLVRDGSTHWIADSGQSVFDFSGGERAGESTRPDRPVAASSPDRLVDADTWYRLGCEWEDSNPSRAKAAYRRALEINPNHAEAHVNLGRLLHESGDAAAATAHYQVALSLTPGEATAAFNLGVALDDLGRSQEALLAYQRAVQTDPTCADAHFNMGRICEKLGRPLDAIRHFKAYRSLVRQDRR